MTEYSPFEKDIEEIETESLSSLLNVKEGWYIEYKREVPNASSIAKSVSAFANTYGGWLFYGINEKSKEDAVAGTFPGITGCDVDGSLQRIRQAVSVQVNPSPHFDTRVLWGPCETIGLDADHAIICIRVPWSPLAPHVHKSGQIYRRVADGSEPKAEADRFVLDQLFRRADDLRKYYRELVNTEPEFSKGELELPYLRLILVADLWHERDPQIDISLDELRSLMGQTQGIVGTVPFDSVHTINRGYLARQIKGNNPFNLGLSWRFYPNLESEVLIPLNVYRPDYIEYLAYQAEGYSNIERFSEILKAEGHENPRVVDLNYIFNLLIGVIEIQDRILKRANWNHSYFYKAQLLNMWRTVPFLDIPAVLDDFEKFGVPICHNSTVISPSGQQPETFIEIRQHSPQEDPVRIMLQTMALFAPIARALGVPAWIERDADGSELAYFQELQICGQRAMESQRLRNERA